MTHSFFTPDLGTEKDSSLARDAAGKLVPRGCWLELSDSSVITAMAQGVGAHLTTAQSLFARYLNRPLQQNQSQAAEK